MDTEEELIKYGFSFVYSKDVTYKKRNKDFEPKGTYTSIEDFEPKDFSQSFLKRKITPTLEYISSELRRNGNIDRESRHFTIIDGGCYEIRVNILFVCPFSSPPTHATHKLKILRFLERGNGISPYDINRHFHQRFDSPNYFFRPLKPFKLYICVNHIQLVD